MRYGSKPSCRLAAIFIAVPWIVSAQAPNGAAPPKLTVPKAVPKPVLVVVEIPVLKHVEFVGVNPDQQREVQRRLSLKEGDKIDADRLASIRSTVQQIDPHLQAFFDGATLRISLESETPPNALSGAVTVGEAVMSRSILERVTPVYPDAAKRDGVGGTVKLNVTIGPDGHVQNVEVASGPAMFAQSATDGVRKWVYKPYLLNSQPVTVKTQVTLNFVLN